MTSTKNGTTPHATAVEVQKSVAGSDAIETVTAMFPSAVVTQDTASWLEGADVKTGHDLEQNKTRLIGIPFKVTGVVFRDGYVDKKEKRVYNYASVEIEIAPADLFRKAAMRRPGILDVGIEPGETLVFNDGSTGVCRQLVAYLHAKGVIQVPDGREDGEVGESRYDTYRAQWKYNGQPVTADDAHKSLEIRPVNFVCLRGLRVSSYETAGQESNTFYLA